MSIITNEITSMPIKIWTSLLKKNRSHFLPLVLGFEKTIIVGKKWNGEKYGIITNARVHKGTRRLVKCNAYVHGL